MDKDGHVKFIDFDKSYPLDIDFIFLLIGNILRYNESLYVELKVKYDEIKKNTIGKYENIDLSKKFNFIIEAINCLETKQ